nr:neurogenic locus notch homolog protein 1-like [Lytechinus pictus]
MLIMTTKQLLLNSIGHLLKPMELSISRQHLSSQEACFGWQRQISSIERDPASDPCNPNPCLSGGDCNQNGDTFTCNCPELTTGSTCEMTLSPCDSNPCLNGGNCTNSADNATFRCNCPFNYTGATCLPDLPSTTESISGTVLLTDRSSTTGNGRQLLCSMHLMMTAFMVLIAFL